MCAHPPFVLFVLFVRSITGGDFCYTSDEVKVIKNEIASLRAFNKSRLLGPSANPDNARVVSGVVFGALTPDGAIASDVMRSVLDTCGALSVTFHRAIDLVPASQWPNAINDLISLNMKYPALNCVLTSGGARSAADGTKRIHELVSKASQRIDVMAGAGVTPNNTHQIVVSTGVDWIHASCRSPVPTVMTYQPSSNVSMASVGTASAAASAAAAVDVKTRARSDEYTQLVCDSEVVQSVRFAANPHLATKGGANPSLFHASLNAAFGPTADDSQALPPYELPLSTAVSEPLPSQPLLLPSKL